MAETKTKSKPTRPARGTVQVAPVPMQPAGSAAGTSPQTFSEKVKAHPYRYGGLAAGGVIGIYLLYQHFHNSSSTAATTAATGTTSGSGGGGRRWSGSGTGSGSSGSGSGGGGGSTNGSTTGTAPGTVDLSGLSGLLSGIQTELGMLGQEIAGMNTGSTSPGGGGGAGGSGGTKQVLPYSMLPGRQPVNTLPSSAKTVNVPVAGATYAIPYTGAKPSPAMVSELGTTIAANAGIASNGITSADIKAAQQSVAAGAGQQAPSGSSRTPAAPKAAAQLPPKTTTAPKAASGSTASSQAALANQISTKVASQPQAKPASTAPKVITTTTGQKEPVNVAGKTSIRPG